MDTAYLVLGRRSRHRLRLRLIRSARLNVLGWAALTAWLVFWAVATGGASVLAGVSSAAGAAVGGLAALAVIVVADRRRWGATECHFVWSDDPEVVQQALRRLTDAGLLVSYRVSPDGEPGIVYRQRDRQRVRATLGVGANFNDV